MSDDSGSVFWASVGKPPWWRRLGAWLARHSSWYRRWRMRGWQEIGYTTDDDDL